MMLMEFDKAGAEWVIVAYLANDRRMIDIIQSGKSPHVVTAHFITGAPEDLITKEDKIVNKATDPDTIEELRRTGCPEVFEAAYKFLPRSMSCRQAGKKSNHGLNYAMRFRRFALENEIDESEAKTMVELYNNEAYPRIPKWQESIRHELRHNDRTLYNLFGSKVRLLDEWGDDLFNAAYSYKPQSTIGEMVNQAICDLYEDRSPECLLADLLTQTHDSATLQYPTHDFVQMAQFAIKFGLGYMNPTLTANGHDFIVATDMKVGLNWGTMKEVKLTRNVVALAAELEKTFHQLQNKSLQ